MILEEINVAYKIYNELIKQIDEGSLNPLDIDIDLFLNNISKNEDIKNSAIFLSLSAKLLKIKADKLISLFFNQSANKATKSTIERNIREALKEVSGLDEEILTLLMEESIKSKLKKTRFQKVKRLSKEEFLKLSKMTLKESLTSDTNYNQLAEEILKKIKEGTFKIRTIKDFIGLMFAIYNYNLVIEDIKSFL